MSTDAPIRITLEQEEDYSFRIRFDDTTIADLGIRTVRFANGLQLNLKTTKFEPGKIAFALRIGDGLAGFPADRQGLRDMLPFVAGIDGLTLHGLRRSFKSLTEWLDIPAGVVAQLMGHKPSATAEKPWRCRRPTAAS